MKFSLIFVIASIFHLESLAEHYYLDTLIVRDVQLKNLVLNTLHLRDREAIIFEDSKSGTIVKIDDKHSSSSKNFQRLKRIISDTTSFILDRKSHFVYLDSLNNAIHEEMPYFNDNGEISAFTGVTQTPGLKAEKYNSIDNKVRIVLNSRLEGNLLLRTFCHELYGHGYLYSLGLDHTHNKVMDLNLFKFVEKNIRLRDEIKSSQTESLSYKN